MKFSLGNLTDAFFEKDPQTPSVAKPVPVGNPVAAMPVATAPPITAMASSDETQGFVDRIRKTLAGNVSATPIQHFMAIAESLTDALPEEGARFRAALKTMVKTEQVTQDQLSAAFQAMLNAVQSENQKFSLSCDTQVKTQVTSREEQVSNLNAQIEKLSQQRDSIATELATSRIQISSTQASFNAAVGIITAEITDSLNKLKIYAPQVAATALK